MPVIPGYSARADVAAPRGNLPTVRVSADAFDTTPRGRIDNGLGGVGEALQGAANTLFKGGLEDRERRIDEAVAANMAQLDPTPMLNAVRDGAAADGSDLYARGGEALDVWRYSSVETIKAAEDIKGEVASRIERRLGESKPRYMAALSVEQNDRMHSFAKAQSDTALNTLLNKTLADPRSYEDSLQLGREVLSAQPFPAHTKAAALQMFEQNLTEQRFDGMLRNAQSAEEAKRVSLDLTAGENLWASKLSPKAYERLLNAASSRQVELRKGADARNGAFFDALKDQTQALRPLDKATLDHAVTLARNSGDPRTFDKAMRVVRDQEILKTDGGLPLPALEAKRLAQSVGVTQGAEALPPALAEAARKAAGLGGVSPGYLMSSAVRESGLANIQQGRFDLTNPESSARGLMQFTEGTWLNLIKSPGVAEKYGIDTAGKTDAELLALRGKEDVSLLMGAALAERNAPVLEAALGRAPSEAELYVAHFLGAKGASDMISTYTTQPDRLASEVNPTAASSNKAAFFDKSGRPFTVKEFLDQTTASFSTQPSRIALGDRDMYDRMADSLKKALGGDIVTYLTDTQNANFKPAPLDGAEGWAERGRLVASLASYHQVPVSTLKPLSSVEASEKMKVVREGTLEAQMQMLGEVQSAGPLVARAALAQIGAGDIVYGYVGRMVLDGDKAETARQVLQGRKLLAENKEVKTLLGVDRNVLNQSIEAWLGPSLLGLEPTERQSVVEAATAHFTASVVSTGEAFRANDKRLRTAVDAVLGDRLGEYNGRKTLVPRGVKPDGLEAALDNVTDADLVALSGRYSTPLDSGGRPVTAKEFKQEAQLVYVGGKNGAAEYKVRMGDGAYLVATANAGFKEAYTLRLSAQDVARLQGVR